MAAPRVGADLVTARERLGRSLPDMAVDLRIRLPYLIALEQGRITDLPGNAYALVFLRSYAAALGLDPDELARRFKAEAAEIGRQSELDFPAPPPERGVPAGAVALIGLVLAVGAYAGWYQLSGEGRLPAEAIAPVPARLAPLAEQAVPLAAPVTVAALPASPSTGTLAPGSQTPSTAAPSRVADSQPADPAVSPGSAAAATPVTAQQASPDKPPMAVAGAADFSPVQGLVVRASADSWIQVRDRAGQVLFSRILHSGESWPVPPGGNLLLTTGNAGGTELLLDGVATAPLGNPGAVRRDLPLDMDAIRSGRLAPVAATR